jgi:hypothetical protein
MRRTRLIDRTRRLAIATTMLMVLSVSPVRAVEDNAPNLIVAGYGVHASASVSCDASNRSMVVTASASTMQASSYSGGVTSGPYDDGQLVTYNVWAREVNAPFWSQMYSWSQWQRIKTFNLSADGIVLIIPVDLGTNVVYGSPGHDYQVVVQIAWLTDQPNIANITPTYYQSYRADDFNTYPFNPTRCVF